MIEIRSVTPADSAQMRDWRNLPEVSRYMYTDHHISQEEHDNWFASMIADKSCRYWIIAVDGIEVGGVNITEISQLHSRCSWAFYLAGPEARGRGVGSVVEYCILSYVFDELRLGKLCCEVLDFNEAVISMHQSFGFVVEGRCRKHIIKQGKAHDVVRLSMLRSEWEALREAVKQKLDARGLLGNFRFDRGEER